MMRMRQSMPAADTEPIRSGVNRSWGTVLSVRR